MTKRRGFTLVEVLMTSVLASLIVAATGGLMVFASKRASHAYSENAVVTQTMQLSGEIEETISDAVGCTVSTNLYGTTLKCVMPEKGVDTDADGKVDSWSATTISSAGVEKYKTGARVWYYWSNASANYSAALDAAHKQFYRAIRSDDSSPGFADIDKRFSMLYSASGTRWSLIDTTTFSQSPITQLVTVTITASKLISQDRRSDGTAPNEGIRDYRLSRAVMSQEWRK